MFIDDFQGLPPFHQHLLAQEYKHNLPGLETPLYDPTALKITVTDPFSNRLIFVERT